MERDEALEEWREAFRRYARHEEGCAVNAEQHPTLVLPTPPCDCGYNLWLAAAVFDYLPRPALLREAPTDNG